ncbi:recombination mediator RecR [Spirochaeta africana]|uniref:Recombination protein RecR n=1 Tax=Spirochaeta africana (strain ATCC 700263 / DSM 8902 / Z-7692) TaxID=889378 RepID=H9UMZ1_SPIAZ|nr:recombination mediator RecR [Spirochaeta africana]AFG38884.1 recombination protein RecR [Spirochaeta africana DSM 8902]
MTSLDQLVRLLAKLPGIGRKSATRMAYHILNSDSDYADSLAHYITEMRERIKPCSVCGSYTEVDPCDICTDQRRDHSMVCVVETAQDVAVLESARVFPGIYHVLGGVISPIDGVGPDDIRIPRLLERIGEGQIREVVLATNPTVEGDTTALYIARQIEGIEGVTTTRLALGLPVGGDLEYVDRMTLERSLRGRTQV